MYILNLHEYTLGDLRMSPGKLGGGNAHLTPVQQLNTPSPVTPVPLIGRNRATSCLVLVTSRTANISTCQLTAM